MKKYPLTVAQKLHFLTLKYCPKKQVLNIGISLTIKEELDWAILKEAIYKGYERCESMRLRFTEDNEGKVMQYVAEREEREIEYFDFSLWTMDEANRKMREWTETPFERNERELNRIVMITTPDGYNGLYLCVDHMTMDAQSLIVFLKDIIELYCNMKYEGIPYPNEMASYIKQLEKDLKYEAGSKAKEKDEKFFKDLIEESEPIFCDIEGTRRLEEERIAKDNPNLRAVVNVSNSVEGEISLFHLEENASNRLMEYCENNNIPMVCLLIMGLRTYLQKFNGQDDVSIMSTIARRGTLAEKRSGGTRIHCFPCRTIVDRNKSFREGIRLIQESQNALFHHANYDPVEYLSYRAKYYNHKQGETYEPFSLTYQPLTLKQRKSIPGQTINFNEIDYKTNWYSNGVCAHELYLTVMHRPWDNGLDFSFEHKTIRVTKEKLEKMYYYICKILFRGIEDENRTIGEIIDNV